MLAFGRFRVVARSCVWASVIVYRRTPSLVVLAAHLFLRKLSVAMLLPPFVPTWPTLTTASQRIALD